MPRIEIRLPTDEEQESALRFRTYVNYLSALGAFLRSEYSKPDALVAGVVTEPAFRRIQGGRASDLQTVKRLLRNAWFTELQIRVAAQSDELIPHANHWAPVQLYYSVYLALRAWFAASGHQVGAKHAATLKAVAGEIVNRPKLFPYPWRAVCQGDPDTSPLYPFLPPGVQIDSVSSLQVAPPFWSSFGMFLRTTRARQIEHQVEEWKRNNKRSRIKAGERRELVTRLPATTLFDALYRLRIRSNYVDADSFLLALENESEAVQFHRALRAVGWCSLLLLELLIAANVGKKVLGAWVSDFKAYDVGRHSAKTVESRWAVIAAGL